MFKSFILFRVFKLTHSFTPIILFSWFLNIKEKYCLLLSPTNICPLQPLLHPKHTPEFGSKLESLRKDIDKIDDELFQHLATRMKLAEQIGAYKRDNGVTILQVGRWEEIVNKRIALGLAMGLGEEFVKEFLQSIHKESIRKQNIVMNKEVVAK